MRGSQCYTYLMIGYTVFLRSARHHGTFGCMLFFLFHCFFFIFLFFFCGENFCRLFASGTKRCHVPKFCRKNVCKYPQNLEICENLLPLKVFPLYGILSLVSNQRNPIAVFLFFCYREKMNWLKTQTQSTHLFTWLAD